MKKQIKDPRFKKCGVNCIVDGQRNIIILRPKTEVGVVINWKDPKKNKSLITNFMVIGNQWDNKEDKIKYKLLMMVIYCLYPKYR